MGSPRVLAPLRRGGLNGPIVRREQMHRSRQPHRKAFCCLQWQSCAVPQGRSRSLPRPSPDARRSGTRQQRGAGRKGCSVCERRWKCQKQGGCREPQGSARPRCAGGSGAGTGVMGSWKRLEIIPSAETERRLCQWWWWSRRASAGKDVPFAPGTLSWVLKAREPRRRSFWGLFCPPGAHPSGSCSAG